MVFEAFDLLLRAAQFKAICDLDSSVEVNGSQWK